MRETDEAAGQGRLRARPRASPSGAAAEYGLRPLGLGRGRDGLVHVPANLDPARPAPLVLALHGAGAEGQQMVRILSPLADAHGLILLAPDSRGVTWDVILDSYGPDVRLIDAALDQIFARHAVDPARVAVAGFSDGASYALSLGLTNGTLLTHVLAFSPGFMAPTATRDSPRFFVSHGTDDAVLPIERTSRPLVHALTRDGYAVTYREFDGPHTVPPALAAEAADWILH